MLHMQTVHVHAMCSGHNVRAVRRLIGGRAGAGQRLDSGRRLLRSGLQVDLRVVARESLGAALHYFTGSKAHNIAVRRLAHTQASRIDVLVANGRKGDRGMRYSRLRARVSAAFGVHGSSSAGRQIRDSRPRASPYRRPGVRVQREAVCNREEVFRQRRHDVPCWNCQSGQSAPQ